MANHANPTNEEYIFYVWSMDNYEHQFNIVDKKKIVSPKFCLSNNNRLTFRLHFYPKCPIKGYENFVALGLGIEGFAGQQTVKVEFSVWLESETSDEIIKKDVTYIFNSGLSHRARVLRSFATRRDLDPSGQFVKENKLKVFCRIRREINEEPSNTTLTVQQKYKMAYKDELFTDFQIIVGNRVFNVHKMVLAINSCVFHAMLSNDKMKESRDNCLELKDADPEIVHKLLKYLYSGELEDANVDVTTDASEVMEKLYQLADKYQVPNLMELCIDYFCDNLEIESVVNCLAIAFQYEIVKLKEQSTAFAINNYKMIMQSAEWKRLRVENPELSAQIFDELIEKSDVICCLLDESA